MLKHTKGPWSLQRREGSLRILGGPNKVVMARLTVCEIPKEELSANAVLMANAPRLLESLRHHCKELRALGKVPEDGENLMKEIEG